MSPSAEGAAPPQLRNLLFVSVPFSGHVNPTLAVAKACAARSAAGLAGAGAAPAAAAAAAAAGAPQYGAVRFASLSSERAKAEAAGVEFVDLGELTEEQEAEKARRLANSVASGAGGGKPAGPVIFPFFERIMAPRLFEAIESGAAKGTDAIVADAATLAGHDAAEKLGLPLVLLWECGVGMALMHSGFNSWNLASHIPIELPGPFLQSAKTLSLAQRLTNPVTKRMVDSKMKALMGPHREAARAEIGLPPAPGLCAFQPGPGLAAGRVAHILGGTMDLEVEPRPLPPNWCFSGAHGVDYSGSFPADRIDGEGEIDAFFQKAAAAGAPIVYVSAGSVVKPTAEQVAAFAGAIGASAAGGGVFFVWSLPKQCQDLLPTDDPGWAAAAAEGRVLVLPWAPQQAILCHPAVKLFVTHAGTNSTYEGLAAGKPMLVLPFFADQPVNAQHIVDKGFGEKLNPWGLQAPDLAAAMARLLADEGTAQRAAAVGERMRAARPGAAVAADQIAAFLASAG